jgi:hypothetical protein
MNGSFYKYNYSTSVFGHGVLLGPIACMFLRKKHFQN